MTEQEKYEKIEAFLREEMTPQERDEFLVMLDADAELQKELALHAEIEGVLIDYDKFRAKERWSKLGADLSDDEQEVEEIKTPGAKQVDRTETPGKSGGLIRKLLPLSMAAAAILALFFAWNMMSSSVVKTAPELADAYYEKPLQLVELDRSTSANAALQKVNADFVYGEYGKAIAALISNQDLSPRDRDLYMGICVYADGKAKEAATILHPLANDSRYKKREQAVWFLILAQLKLERKADAKKFLNLMLDEKLGNQKQVESLLQELGE